MPEWGLRRKPQVGQSVQFQMPLEGKDIGTVKSVDGSYCYITVPGPFKHQKEDVDIERYWESELRLV